MTNVRTDRSAVPDEITDGRKRRGAQSRAAILMKAARMASVEGLEGLTLGRLATDAGVNKSNLQVLFGGKEALQVATLDAANGIFVDHVVRPAMRRKSPLNRLAALNDGWFDYVAKRILPGGCLMYGASSEYRARDGVVRARVIRGRNAWRELLLRNIEAALEAGQCGPNVDPQQLVFEIRAFQGAANVAALLGDASEFDRARRSARRCVALARKEKER
jgi:AcrR family transcriptional regulator